MHGFKSYDATCRFCREHGGLPRSAAPRAAQPPAASPVPTLRRAASPSRATTPQMGMVRCSWIEKPGWALRDRHGVPATALRCVDIFLPSMGDDLLIERAAQIGFGNEAGAHAMRRDAARRPGIASPPWRSWRVKSSRRHCR